MSPTNPYIISQLRSQIYYHLDNNLVRNACFLAGRLVCYGPRNPDAAYLLALCQLQSGQIKAAWETSKTHAKRSSHLGCCYIYAQAALELGKFVEGIGALERAKPMWINRNGWSQSESWRHQLPDAAAIYTLQGRLFHAHKDLSKAVDCWVEALKLNPFMWDAFLGLCDSGANINIPNIFKPSPDMIALLKATQPEKSAPPDPFMSSKPGHGSSALWEKLNGNIHADELESEVERPWEPPAPRKEKVKKIKEPDPPAAPKRTISGHVAQSSVGLNQPEGARRSRRLLTAQPAKISSLASSLLGDRDIKKPKVPKTRTATTATVGRVVSGNRTRVEGVDGEARVAKLASLQSQASKDYEGLMALLELFGRIAHGCFRLSRYDCHGAIKFFKWLPLQHQNSPFILASIGKAYYEQGVYAEAEKYFIKIREDHISSLDDMEVYSTVLWHMKNDVELAYLAHELIENDRLSPQAWCAVGNSFSLQREHEQALKCFRRATQLDAGFAYGFTLQGHEYIANEEYDKALDAYRSGVNADPRHYNAWYGLGKVYEKMGKYDIAEQHYLTAAGINPSNAVLLCCIGMVLEKSQRYEDALDHYSKACVLAPGSALSRFRKARVLVQLQETQQALIELNILKDVAPDEANVFFLLGRLYKKLKMRGEAVRAFTSALNLDPKASQYIKDAMETLDDDNEDASDD